MSSNAELASAYISLIPSFKGAEAAVTQGMSGMGEAAGQKASGGFLSTIGSVTGRVVGIAAGGVAAVGGLIGGLAIRGGITRSLDIENATAKLAGLGHSTQEVSLIMGNAMTSVKGTAYGMGDAATVAAGAVAAGVKPGADLTRVLKEIADTSTITGLSMGQTGAIFNKVAASNRLNLGDVNQLSQQGLPILDMLAKKYGVSAEAASKMVTQGKVNFQDFSDAIQANIGGAALKSGNTTEGAFANMGAALSRVGVTLTGGFFPLFKGVFNQVTIILDGLNARIGPSMTRFGAWFQAGATPAVSRLASTTLAALDSGGAAVRRLWAGLSMSPAARAQLSTPLDGLTRFGALLRGLWDGAAPVFAAIGAGFAGLWAALRAGNYAGLLGHVGTIAAALAGLAGPVGAHLVAVGQSVGVAAGALGTMIGGALPLLTPVIQAAANVMGFLSDHTGLLLPAVAATAAGFVLVRVAQTAVNFAEIGALPIKAAAVAAMFAQAAENRANAAGLVATRGGLTASMASRAPAIIQIIGHTVATAAHAVALAASAVAMGIATAAQWAFNLVLDANPVGLVVLAIVALVAAIVLLVLNWSTVTAFVTTVWAGCIAWLAGTMAGLGSWWSGIWSGILAFVSQVWSNIGAVVRAAVLVLALAVQSGLTTAQNTTRAILGAIGSFFASAFNLYLSIVRATLGAIVGSLGTNFAGYLSTVRTILGAIGSFFASAFNSYLSIVRATLGAGVAVVTGGMGAARQDIAAAIHTAEALWSGTVARFESGVSGAISRVPGFLANLPGLVLGVLGNPAGWLSDVGRQIIAGLAAGILNQAHMILDAIGGALSGTVKFAKKLLGIKSPSTVMAKTVGAPLIADFAASIPEQARTTVALPNMDAGTVTSFKAQREESQRPAPSVNVMGPVYDFDPETAPRQWQQWLADAKAVGHDINVIPINRRRRA